MTPESRRGILVVVSGPAGSGKGTVLAKLLQDDRFRYSVSATTRAPRPGEVNGVNYHFLTKEDFSARIAAGEMLEYTEYCGNFYGTPMKEAEEMLRAGFHLILEIETVGALNVKKTCPDALSIMLLPPSFAVQEARLRGRGTETEECIKARLTQTKWEVSHVNDYDYVVFNHNGGAAEAAEAIRNIVIAETHSISRNPHIDQLYFED